MDNVERGTRVKGQDRIIERHLLGLGVLLLTVTAGYLLSGLSGGREALPAAHQARAASTQAQSTSGDKDTDSEIAIDAHIREVASRYGMSAELVAAVIEAESEFNPRAVSRQGAQGLMQLMPKTAATLGVDDPFDPRANIEAGVRHLRALMDRFGNDLPLVLAAYNAGEVAVIKHRGVPPYRETRAYVKRILKRLDRATPAVRL